MIPRSALEAWVLRCGFAPVLCVVALGIAPVRAAAVPSFEQVRAAWRSSQTVVLDRHGVPVQSVRTDLHAHRLEWVALDQVSPAMQAAVIAAEDRRFLAHDGVDWRAVAAAAIGRAGAEGSRGASTITMQLAGLLDTDLAPRRGGRSIGTKIAQAATALEIERHWRKDQILEAWLNLVPFRGEDVGVAAMAQDLFGKSPSGLNGEESAIAAALLRGPNAVAAVVGRRACEVLESQGPVPNCAPVRGLAELVLGRGTAAPGGQNDPLAPHFARRALALAAAAAGAASAPATLKTTLDAAAQRMARDALRAQLEELRDRAVEDGAVVVLDNASGEVLAWVGSSGELSRAAAVDGVLASRQPGSTLKPFLYELAIERRWLSAASVLDDSPAQLSTPSGLYVPQDYDHEFKGPVSVRTALGASLNVPAVRTLVLVSPDRFARRLVSLGLPIARPGDFYGYSLALGSAEVNLLSLTNAYRALANGGVVGAPRLLPVAPRPVARSPAAAQVMDPAAVWIVDDILADNDARVPTFGLDNALATPYRSAVKTGTSKDMRDNWCIGFSAHYTVGVWVGNASGAPMHAVSGVSGAAPVWRTILDALERRGPGDSARSAAVRFGAPAPAGVTMQAIDYTPPIEPARREWFIAGTETSHLQLASAAGRAARRIAAPEDGTVVAIDPDIPPAVQRMRFEAVRPLATGSAWRLDGRRLGAATMPTSWAPWPGQHLLELVDGRGRAVDAVRFEVRGAQVTSPIERPAVPANKPHA